MRLAIRLPSSLVENFFSVLSLAVSYRFSPVDGGEETRDRDHTKLSTERDVVISYGVLSWNSNITDYFLFNSPPLW